MESHQYFVEKVGGDLIRRKGLTVEDYMYNVIQPHVPLDEIGILLYTRMYAHSNYMRREILDNKQGQGT